MSFEFPAGIKRKRTDSDIDITPGSRKMFAPNQQAQHHPQQGQQQDPPHQQQSQQQQMPQAGQPGRVATAEETKQRYLQFQQLLKNEIQNYGPNHPRGIEAVKKLEQFNAYMLSNMQKQQNPGMTIALFILKT